MAVDSTPSLKKAALIAGTYLVTAGAGLDVGGIVSLSIPNVPDISVGIPTVGAVTVTMESSLVEADGQPTSFSLDTSEFVPITVGTGTPTLAENTPISIVFFTGTPTFTGSGQTFKTESLAAIEFTSGSLVTATAFSISPGSTIEVTSTITTTPDASPATSTGTVSAKSGFSTTALIAILIPICLVLASTPVLVFLWRSRQAKKKRRQARALRSEERRRNRRRRYSDDAPEVVAVEYRRSQAPQPLSSRIGSLRHWPSLFRGSRLIADAPPTPRFELDPQNPLPDDPRIGWVSRLWNRFAEKEVVEEVGDEARPMSLTQGNIDAMLTEYGNQAEWGAIRQDVAQRQTAAALPKVRHIAELRTDKATEHQTQTGRTSRVALSDMERPWEPV